MSLLPRRFRPYFTPNVRRVYLDTTRVVELEKERKIAKKRIKKFEKDQETLLRQCERHMETARVHAEGEKQANVEIGHLRRRLRDSLVVAMAEKEKDDIIEDLKAEADHWKRNYTRLREKSAADLESSVAERDDWKSKYRRLEEEHSAMLDSESDLEE
ncbi:hypothetical protein DXG03_007518 [Asterophora parasitica]|uniref:Uncharacterized protein n=1 Tax=Asterophora parasitica TaxID=117018 RepID=A0A9P7GD93_9AGAR|nr:hypothetical protein DXG03_007518 [Asterophora parasitica]